MSKIERDKQGRFVSKPPQSPAITSENARDLQRKSVESRRRNQRKANEEAMVTALRYELPDDGIETPQDAAAVIVAKQAIKAASPDLPGTTAAARFVFQETGRDQERQQQAQGAYIKGAQDMAGLLAAALVVEEGTRTVEAEWKELSEPDTDRETENEQTPPTTSGGVG